MRVYVPATLTDLSALLADGQATMAVGYGASPELNALLDDDEDAGEYLATSLAAAHARGLDDESAARLVFTMELPDSVVAFSSDAMSVEGARGELVAASAVVIREPLTRGQVVCVHVDDTDTRPGQPRDPLDLAGDLLWFGSSEISDVLATYGARAT